MTNIRFGKVTRVFVLNIDHWLVADVQARAGQQCLHLPWCQSCRHCRRWTNLTLRHFQVITIWCLIFWAVFSAFKFHFPFHPLNVIPLSLLSRHSSHLGRCVPLFSRSSCRYGHRRRSRSWQVVGYDANIQTNKQGLNLSQTKYKSTRDSKRTHSFRLSPPLSNIQEISVQIAKKVNIVTNTNVCGNNKLLFRWLRKHMNRIRHQHIPSPRTRRLSSGLTSTTTTTIRWSLLFSLHCWKEFAHF